ncbi:MAG: hypothetical protein QG605_1428, partial [Euryarchaeota archaeon]|nr:hypothetical protein [Euryarchaeota archaeon]
MQKYYLLAEAFNNNPVVYDTYDISTIRGGSFILLNAITFLRNTFEGRLKPIATAASTGLFAYEDTGNLDAQKTGMAEKVLRVLHNATDGHATFLIAVEKDIPDNFPLVLARLEAEVRRKQWRMPTVVVPQFKDTDQECYFDGWRPGVVDLRYKVDPDLTVAKISEAANFRREVGRMVKQRLFSRLLDGYEDDLIAKDLGKLATNDHKGILSGKIALIHVDGNSFGRIRKEVCDTETKRTKFDDVIQEGCRKVFLRDVLKRAHTDPDFQV